MNQSKSVPVGEAARNNSNVNRSILLAVSAVAIGALIATSAGAASQHDPHSTSVHFADLNTHTPEGIAALYRRIRQAAEAVCLPYEIRQLAQASAARICFEDAVANAVKSVNLRSLTAYANTKRGHASQIVVAARGG
jgi:UrcA family protein